MALTDSAVHYRGHHEPLVGGIYHARYCYPFRTPASEDPTEYALEDVRRVLRAEIYGDDVAAILVEPIQGEGGFIVPTAEFMHGLRAIADEIGACLIIDEIQAGMGRTGKWFCHEHYGVKPDIVTIAKGIASGYPLAAIAAQPRALGQVPARLHGRHLRRQRRGLRGRRRHHRRHARRGHARERREAGREAPQVLHRPAGHLPGHRRRPRHGPHVGHRVRRAGRQEPNAAAAKAFMAECVKRHLIIMGAGGALGNCVRFLPPLNISDADMDIAFGIFTEAAKVAFA